MTTIRGFNTLRARSYILRLPLFTRIIILVLALFWGLSIQSIWDVKYWGALIPDQISITAAYRLSTYPLVHFNFIHAVLNIVALTPLVERFEREYGTITSLALFFGPLTTLPGFLYLIVELYILRGNTVVMGASVWVFLLLGMEAMRTYRTTNPHFAIGSHQIPTWTTPLIMVLIVAALIPNTSLLGHLCGLGVGYVCGMGYIKYLAPPVGASLDRVAPQPPRRSAPLCERGPKDLRPLRRLADDKPVRRKRAQPAGRRRAAPRPLMDKHVSWPPYPGIELTL
jgi:membrane associated rhomboid family serine protease